MKELYLIRGLPGSGKSTLAKSIGGIHIEADQYFVESGVYKFDVLQLKMLTIIAKTKPEHGWNQMVLKSMLIRL